MITDQLPSGWRAADGSGVINIPVGTLAAGQSREFESIVKPGERGTANNTATARADGDLTATSNTTTTVVRLPALAITKAAPDRRFIGRDITYEITVRNTGDGEARDCMLEDMIPAGATFVSASDGGRSDGSRVTWNLGTLAPEANRTVTLTIKPGAGGIVRNTATVKAYCAAAATGTAETSVEGIPAVLLEVVDIEDPIEVGSNETYVITVTNQGSAPDTDIRIAFMLEDTMEFVSGTGASAIQGVAAAGTRNFEFAPLPSLAPGADAVWRVVVKGVAPGDARFTVTMNTDQLGRNVQETEATNFYK
jgi:uncharacterized repeat protein (TIGR01451 family)